MIRKLTSWPRLCQNQIWPKQGIGGEGGAVNNEASRGLGASPGLSVEALRLDGCCKVKERLWQTSKEALWERPKQSTAGEHLWINKEARADKGVIWVSRGKRGKALKGLGTRYGARDRAQQHPPKTEQGLLCSAMAVCAKGGSSAGDGVRRGGDQRRRAGLIDRSRRCVEDGSERCGRRTLRERCGETRALREAGTGKTRECAGACQGDARACWGVSGVCPGHVGSAAARTRERTRENPRILGMSREIPGFSRKTPGVLGKPRESSRETPAKSQENSE